MGKPTGFMEFARQDAPKRPAKERIHDYREIEQVSGQDCGMHLTGGLLLADTEERVQWTKSTAAGPYEAEVEWERVPEVAGIEGFDALGVLGHCVGAHFGEWELVAE